MIGDQRAISLFTSAPNGPGPRLALSGMSQPSTSMRLRVASSSSALSSASASLLMADFGVPFGANRPFHADTWKSGSAASALVGTPGMAGLRTGDEIA